MADSISVPVATLKVTILLSLILIFSITDLSLLLVNAGITSFLLGLTATCTTIVHISTHLFIIIFRSRWRATCPPHPSPWQLLPPTSKSASLAMNTFLAVIFTAGFSTTLVAQRIDYFGHRGGGLFGDGTSSLKGPVGIVYADAAMELLCAIMLGALTIVGSLERRLFVEVGKKICSEDGRPV